MQKKFLNTIQNPSEYSIPIPKIVKKNKIISLSYDVNDRFYSK